MTTRSQHGITRVYLSKRAVAKNAKLDPRDHDPPLRVLRDGYTFPAYEVRFIGPSHLHYSPEKPLKNGIEMWIETQFPVEFR